MWVGLLCFLYFQKNSARTLYVWDASTGDEVLVKEGFNGPVALSHDGTRVTGSHDYSHEFRVWKTSKDGDEGFSIDWRASSVSVTQPLTTTMKNR
jgi:hypothetical protein